MEKKPTVFAVILLLLCLPGFVFGQIPNAGFENWTGNDPADWATSNSLLGTTISPSATVHGGTFAAKGIVVSIVGGYSIQPVLQSGPTAEGFPTTLRPSSFSGYYQFFPAASSGDRFGVNVGLYKGGINGVHVAIAAAAIPTPVSSYTQFTIPFTYLTSDVPDTCIIEIQIVGPGTGNQAIPSVGSYFLLDDLSFTGISGIADGKISVPNVFELHQNYPNPFNPSTNISFTVPSNGKATLTVFNLLGQQVATLFDGRVSSGRFFRATFNASGLPSGVYFSRLDFVPSGATLSRMELMRKMTLLK